MRIQRRCPLHHLFHRVFQRNVGDQTQYSVHTPNGLSVRSLVLMISPISHRSQIFSIIKKTLTTTKSILSEVEVCIYENSSSNKNQSPIPFPGHRSRICTRLLCPTHGRIRRRRVWGDSRGPWATARRVRQVRQTSRRTGRRHPWGRSKPRSGCTCRGRGLACTPPSRSYGS